MTTPVTVSKLGGEGQFRCFKLSKRYDQDISAVMGAVRLHIRSGQVTDARIAFGGMAATPKRARAAETKLRGLSVNDESAIHAALAILGDDFKPLDDMRASADYRLEAAKALVAKAVAEIAGLPSTETRVFGARSDAHAA